MHFPAPAIFFDQLTMISLSGADFSANINGMQIPLNHAVIINKNTTLQFLTPKNKSRCYLAVKGGVKISKWLNSYSTNLVAEAGGFSGRKLLKDDILELNTNTNTYKLQDTTISKFYPGAQMKILGSNTKKNFW
jgi:Allophanate hydrolase subunit 2